ncbi:kelch motif family protein, putative [Ichthyophthirius multifiliis]|uniref:Kelch motif family protein, putative n=1 Tax=Ichthyophthirius multifiliis TaxID=5932 RepID=G0R1A0_ICHMU|nr:kelch motif family protein, putative [Ichthyophthirius multifiliis]EGR28733.1 kelch motif family protein, putative [Ichthyophthirius multifiliis]|eukprot:XP_004029969.1 kelch motif family protein, putative [Ichthyophthirius multifiliis]
MLQDGLITYPNNINFLYCQIHQDEIYTNFCTKQECLKPLCPECIDHHNKNHSKQNTYAILISLKVLKSQCVERLKLCKDKLLQYQDFLDGKNTLLANDFFDEGLIQIKNARENLINMIQKYFNQIEEEYSSRIRSFSKRDTDINNILEQIKSFSGEIEQIYQNIQSPYFIKGIQETMNFDLQTKMKIFENQIQEIDKNHNINQIDIIIDKKRLEFVKMELNKYIQLGQTQNQEIDYLQENVENNFNLYSEVIGNNLLECLFIIQSNYFIQSNKFLPFLSSISKQLYLFDIEKPKLYQNIQIWQDIPEFHKIVVCPGGQIFLLGGVIKGVQVNNVYQWSFNKQQFIPKSNMIQARSSFSAIYLKEKIYVVGGYKEGQQAIQNCEVYDIKKDIWKEIATFKIPDLLPSVCAFQDEYLVKIGDNNVEIYDIQYDKWFLANRNQKQIGKFQNWYNCGIIQINKEEIVIIGGQYKNFISDQIFVFNFYKSCKDQFFYQIKNIEYLKLPFKDVFYNNIVIDGGKLFWLQNVFDAQKQNQQKIFKRIIIFDGYQFNFQLINL